MFESGGRTCRHFRPEAGREEEGPPLDFVPFSIFFCAFLEPRCECVRVCGRCRQGYERGQPEAGVGEHRVAGRDTERRGEQQKTYRPLRRKGTMQVDVVFCGVRLRKMRNYSRSTSSGLIQLREDASC